MQLGVTRNLIGNRSATTSPGQTIRIEPAWYSLEYTFTMEEGEARLPPPPVR